MDRINRSFISSYGLESVTRNAFDATGTDTYQMGLTDRVTLIDSTLGAGTVYLPPVSEAFGKIFTVQVETYGSAVTVKPYEHHSAKPDSVIYDGSGAETSQALGSDEAFTVLFSTGRAWIVLGFDLDTAS